MAAFSDSKPLWTRSAAGDIGVDGEYMLMSEHWVIDRLFVSLKYAMTGQRDVVSELLPDAKRQGGCWL